MALTLEELFRRHASDVLAYALRRTDPQTAEDVVSEVFLIAGRRLDRVPESAPHLWLYSVARRVMANQRRAERRREALARAVGRTPRGPSPTEPASLLLEALASLRPADREVLMLTAWEGLDAASAGRVLGCSTHAVHTRLHRARTRLQSKLDELADPDLSTAAPEAAS